MSVATVRAAAHRGGTLRRIRKECRALDDAALLKRLCRYTGRTIGEERRRNRAPWSVDFKAINRESVIDIIAHYEVGS